MLNFFKKDPENPENLAALNPAHRYTREEIEKFMDFLMGGLVVDGLLMIGWGFIDESAHYYVVEVEFEDPASKTYNVSENWYFYKVL